MASFTKQLDQLLAAARERGLVDPAAADRIAEFAAERERERGVLSLGGVLGQLGAAASILGVILLIAANWDEIGDFTKIAGFLVLLGAVHGAGLWIRWSGRPDSRFAEALNFLGAGLFLAGLALIGQIYHLPENNAGGMLMWLVAIAPLAVLLRSPVVTGLAILAAWLWLHFQAADRVSPFYVHGFDSFVMLSLGLGLALIGTQSWVPPGERRIRLVVRGAGQLMLFYAVYMLGFFRHFSHQPWSVTTGSITLPLGMLLLGVVGVGLGFDRLAPEVPWLRRRLGTLLVVLLATSAAAFLVDIGLIPGFGQVQMSEFGERLGSFHVSAILVSVAAWVVWFLFALWCVAYGTVSRQRDYVNLGVLGFGLGIVTRFIDLMGGMSETGTLFVMGGVVLLATAWAMERWRRTLFARMESVA